MRETYKYGIHDSQIGTAQAFPEEDGL